MFQRSGLKLREVVVPHLEKGSVIPNETHPSDHLPVQVMIEFTSAHDFAQNAVKVWCVAVLGKERIMPLNKAALEAAFAALSVDGEVIEVERLVATAEQVLPARYDDVVEALDDASLSTSNALTIDDFLLAYNDALVPDRLIGDEEIALAFDHFDIDGDGRISMADLREALRQMSPVPVEDDTLESFFERAHVDYAGSLSRKCFINAVKGISISRTSICVSAASTRKERDKALFRPGKLSFDEAYLCD